MKLSSKVFFISGNWKGKDEEISEIEATISKLEAMAKDFLSDTVNKCYGNVDIANLK